MKFKNKYIKKIIASGLVGSLLLSSTPFNSFASTNKINGGISSINTESEDIKEISPQMLAVLSSLAVGSGITITTDDDLYDLGKLFYDWIDNHNDLTWETVTTTFVDASTIVGKKISIDNKLLNIVKDFFNNTFNNIQGNINTCIGLPYFGTNTDPQYMYDLGNTFVLNEANDFWLGDIYWKNVSPGSLNTYYAYYKDKYLGEKVLRIGDSFKYGCYKYGDNLKFYYSDTPQYSSGLIVSICEISSVDIVEFSYLEGYDWNYIESKIENDKILLPVPSNLNQLVSQSSEDFWYNTDNLINPCTQEITLSEVENASINIAESIRLQTEVNCSIYNAEELVTKAEESKNPTDIENARTEVNKLTDSQEKEDLQDRLNAIIPNITLTSNSGTANLDVYIKSENSLVMTLDTSSISFDGFSSVEDMVKENAVTVTIKSSLPYELNSYLMQEITNIEDNSKTLDKSILNIKANGTDDYSTFEDIGTTPVLLLDNQSPGEVNEHGIDFMLDADIPYENGNYKTIIKFEAEQK